MNSCRGNFRESNNNSRDENNCETRYYVVAVIIILAIVNIYCPVISFFVTIEQLWRKKQVTRKCKFLGNGERKTKYRTPRYYVFVIHCGINQLKRDTDGSRAMDFLSF